MDKSVGRPLRAVVAAAALVLVPLTASPADAARLTLHDARGDMGKIEEGATVTEPAPGATIGDFTRTRFWHTDRRVAVKASFVEVNRTGRRFILWVDVRDERGKEFILGVRATKRDRGGHTILMTGNGRDIDCAVWHRIDYDRNFVRVGLPRRCLGNPRTVRFGVLSEHVRRSLSYAWLDNGLGSEIGERQWRRRLRHG